MKRVIYALALRLARAFQGHPRVRSVCRRAQWDLAAPGTLLLSDGPERFVVAAGDQHIGRTVFLYRQPYDFQKFERVVRMLAGRESLVLIDVGANIGTICIPAVKRGHFARAIAFEPEPRNFAMLVANIALNGVGGQVQAHNLALGDKEDATLELDLSTDNLGDHRVRPPGLAHDRQVIRVPSQTLDRMVPGLDASSTLLWMDTQGFEGFVLAGAKKALSGRPALVIEFWPFAMAQSGAYPALKAALSEAGYRNFRNVDEVDAVPTELTKLDDLWHVLGEREEVFVDLLFT